MKKILICFLIIESAYGQIPGKKIWDSRLGGEYYEYPAAFIQTLDHGFLIGGYTLSDVGFEKTDSSRGDEDYWIIRTDSNGNKLWDKTFGGDLDDRLSSVIALPDSGFLIGGSSTSSVSGDRTQPLLGFLHDFWVIKIDKFGNKIWDRAYGGNQSDHLQSMLLMLDNNYLLGGMTASSISGNVSHSSFGFSDYWIIKIDTAGNYIWDYRFGGNSGDDLYEMALTSDNAIVLGGSSSSQANGSKSQPAFNSKDYWILKVDTLGNVLWDATYGGTKGDYPLSIAITPGGRIVVGGFSESGGISGNKTVANLGGLYFDFWVVCLDNAGNFIWQDTFGGDNGEDEFGSVSVFNKGLLFTGTSYSGVSGDKTEANSLGTEQPWIFVTDTNGNKLWDMTILNASHVEHCLGININDSCFVFSVGQIDKDGGYVSMARNSYTDYWLVKFCSSDLMPIAKFSSSVSTFCGRQCVDFANYSLNATSYQWFFPGGFPLSDTSANPLQVCYNDTGKYDVTLIASNSFGSDTLKFQNYVTEHPHIVFFPLYISGDTIFATPGMYSYQWRDGNYLNMGGNYYVPYRTGIIYVYLTDSNQCKGSDSIYVVFNSINQLNQESNFIYSFENEKLTLNIRSSKFQNANIYLLDISGRIIQTKNTYVSEGENKIEFPLNISSGIFFLRIDIAEFSKTIKVPYFK